ncbi:MAG: DUF3883 domain-containing protein [Proteobacteria bacterium]|jgi:nucleoside-diphosphate-sugar epimerase|nr:DUF3883 domain-containing protein [Alphaproteobacteria bacterium]NCC02829.1 DUF3883 domain-containing protein [Pseudomonadota bacterium]
MTENHEIEKYGVAQLAEHLRSKGHNVRVSDKKTYDLIVDNQYAEVKTKAHGWSKFDFISLTQNQHNELGKELKKIYVVLNAKNADKIEFWEIDAKDLIDSNYNTIIHYEWNKGQIAHLRKA